MNKKNSSKAQEKKIKRSDNLAPLFSPKIIKGVKSYVAGIDSDPAVIEKKKNAGVINEEKIPGKEAFF